MTPSGWPAFLVSSVAALLLLLAPLPAHAQVSALGKGWQLDSVGSLTSTPGEVISGRNSIKGSYAGPDDGFGRAYLYTNPTFIQFPPNQTLTITASYRIITAGSAGFEYGFNSPGHGLPSALITGASGASGTATLTVALQNHTDYSAFFKVSGTGAIAIDDIRITNSAGQLVASENAEGPT